MRLTKGMGKAFWALFFAAAVVYGIGGVECAESGVERLKLSVPNLKIEKSERIDGFRVTVLHGYVIGVPRIPPGWSLKIDAGREWRTIVTGEAGWGVAFLGVQDVNFFDGFLIVGTDDVTKDLFSVDMEISTTDCTKSIPGKANSCVHKRYIFKITDLKLIKIRE